MTHASQTGGVEASGRSSRVPPVAAWLGGSGALPFVALALLAFLGPGEWANWASRALAFYGAVILSFLGGIQWGLSIATGSPAPDSALTRRLATSVAPSLIGWAALLLPLKIGLLMMTAAFALILYADVRASMKGEAPDWYPKLRIPLSSVVMASLVAGALA